MRGKMTSITYRKLLDLTALSIDTFGLLSSSSIQLAFSGGKDSFVTAILLRDLGIDFQAIAVDMGYTNGWGERLRSNLSAFGIELEVIEVYSNSTIAKISPAYQTHFKHGLSKLEEIDPFEPKANVTPCTHCYNSKLHCMASMYTSENVELVFGHHETDALASLIKSFLMYVDSVKEKNQSYSNKRFRCLAEKVTKSLTSSSNAQVLNEIEVAINNGVAGTDEPPRQNMIDRHGVEIIRPLWYVNESLIKSLSSELNLPVEGSGCGHGAAKCTRTPREIIHWEMLPALHANKSGLQALSILRSLLNNSITSDGRYKYNVRNNRGKIVGDNYKLMSTNKL